MSNTEKWEWRHHPPESDILPELVTTEGREVCDFGSCAYGAQVAGTEPDYSDGCLMAAAPELADALESALAEIRKIVDEGPFYNSDEWDEGPALAALRKAGRLP